MIDKINNFFSSKNTNRGLLKQNKKLQRRIFKLEQAVESLLEDNPEYLKRFPAFNDQILRQQLFLSLIDLFTFDLIIETGTKWGNTTAFIAINSNNIPIHTSEALRESFLIARERLKHFPIISIKNCDSRKFLKDLIPKDFDHGIFPFFYLDAHWNNDLPLAEEIEIIASNWGRFIILVDDFQVPSDEGYGYDDYGNGKTLNFNYLKNLIEEYQLRLFYPSIHSKHESGARRGCALICDSTSTYEKLMLEKTLVEHR